MRKQKPENQLAVLTEQLEWEHRHWCDVRDGRWWDQFGTDGSTMNLIRNHIIGHRQDIKALCDEHGLPVPEIYSVPVPEEADVAYMAQPEKIVEDARTAADLFETDPMWPTALELAHAKGKRSTDWWRRWLRDRERLIREARQDAHNSQKLMSLRDFAHKGGTCALGEMHRIVASIQEVEARRRHGGKEEPELEAARIVASAN